MLLRCLSFGCGMRHSICSKPASLRSGGAFTLEPGLPSLGDIILSEVSCGRGRVDSACNLTISLAVDISQSHGGRVIRSQLSLHTLIKIRPQAAWTRLDDDFLAWVCLLLRHVPPPSPIPLQRSIAFLTYCGRADENGGQLIKCRTHSSLALLSAAKFVMRCAELK